MSSDEADIELTASVIKAGSDPVLQTLLAWASVTHGDDGAPLIDRQGDVITLPTLKRAVLDLMLDDESDREIDLDHTGAGVGQIVGSLVVDDLTAKALGLPTKKRGWLVEVHVPDPDLYQKLASNPGTGFSIAGRGKRVPYDGN